MSAAARTDGARRRILDEKRSRGAAQTGAQALITQYRSMMASEGLPRRVRRGMRTRDRLVALRFAVDDFDLLAGRPLFSLDYLPVAMGGSVPDAEHQAAETFCRQSAPEPGQSGHCELDRSKAFELGLDTLRKSMECQATGAQGSAQETYQAFALAVAGLSTMIVHAAEAVEAAMPAATAPRQAELRRMAESCRRVAHEPPRSFLDALHLAWFIDLGVQFADDAGLAGPGHLDRTLSRYYQSDLASGALTKEDALQLIEALYLHSNHAIADGVALPVMVGGRDADGRDLTNEPLRLHFHNAQPKYGNADATVDALVGVVVERIKRECARHKMAPQESHFVPGAFCWIMHEQLGRVCGATPDGRKAGFPFADGGGPAQGCERNGPTSAILSTTSWDHAPLIGGVAYNMKFNSTLFDSPASVKRLEDLLVTYLRRGGFEVQVNVVNQETLAKARENPEQFRDLVVRIGGYTDYFTRLSPHMQEEVMKRTAFGHL
jgi:pyruvate-formate lyase